MRARSSRPGWGGSLPRRWPGPPPTARLFGFPARGGAAPTLYYETAHDPSFKKPPPRSSVPTGVLVSTQDVTIRRWAERENNVVHWTELEHGGHFAALEAPSAFVADLRKFFRLIQ